MAYKCVITLNERFNGMHFRPGNARSANSRRFGFVDSGQNFADAMYGDGRKKETTLSSSTRTPKTQWRGQPMLAFQGHTRQSSTAVGNRLRRSAQAALVCNAILAEHDG
jgi:hypothetical protein